MNYCKSIINYYWYINNNLCLLYLNDPDEQYAEPKKTDTTNSRNTIPPKMNYMD